MSADCDLAPDRFFPVIRETAAEVEDGIAAIRQTAEAEGWHASVIEEIAAVAAERGRRIRREIDEREAAGGL
jgi:hypothetical protein